MPDRRLLAPVAAVLVALALTGCGARTAAAPAAPAPVPSATASRDTGLAAHPQDPVPAAADTASSARPVRVVIPSIGVDAPLLKLARDAAGVLAAPPPGDVTDAGWYAKGTVPGQVGPAVIAGHVDWVDRVAVFHRLGELRAGDEIDVRMSDRSTVRFTVTRTQTVSKFRFPTQAVYGPTPDAELRVITCGGPWDDARDIYSENVIVYAARAA